MEENIDLLRVLLEEPHVVIEPPELGEMELEVRSPPYTGLAPRRVRRGVSGLDVPEDATTGADIGRLVAAGDWAGVAAHCRANIIKTHTLAARLGLLTTAASTIGAPDGGGVA